MTSDWLMMQGTFQSIGGVTLYFLLALANPQITFEYDKTHAQNGMIST